jgi:hypothetical protein
VLRDLIKLANHLDSKGLLKEADFIDLLIKESQEDGQEEDEQEKDSMEYYKNYFSMDDVSPGSEYYDHHINNAKTGNCGKFALTIITKLYDLKKSGKIKDLELMLLYDGSEIESPGGPREIESLIGSFVNHAFVYADGYYYDANGRFLESEFSSHLNDSILGDNFYVSQFPVNSTSDIEKYMNALEDIGILNNQNNFGYDSAVEEMIIKPYFS